MIYFDNNATTPVLPEVYEVMKSFYQEGFGNPSSVYQAGNQVRVSVEKARGNLARALDAMPSEIVFTGSGTESDNMALWGIVGSQCGKGKNLIISKIEHPAVTETAKWLEGMGVECRQIPILEEGGKISIKPFVDAMDEHTVLISVMMANNETGLLLPVKEIFREAQKRGILCHTDAVQAFGKIPVSVKDIGCDLLTVSAHKIHGPKGVGALFLKRGTPFQALIHGGAQENSRRPGTENAAGIAGLGEAVLHLNQHVEHILEIRDYFEEQLQIACGERVVIHHQHLSRTPNTTSVGFPGQDGNMVLIKLDQKGICVSTGSACHSGALSTNSTLLQLGISEIVAKGTLRFSFSRFSKKTEVDKVIEVLKHIV